MVSAAARRAKTAKAARKNNSKAVPSPSIPEAPIPMPSAVGSVESTDHGEFISHLQDAVESLGTATESVKAALTLAQGGPVSADDMTPPASPTALSEGQVPSLDLSMSTDGAGDDRIPGLTNKRVELPPSAYTGLLKGSSTGGQAKNLPPGDQAKTGRQFFRGFEKDFDRSQDGDIKVMKRNGDFVTTGKPVSLSINSYNVTAFPTKAVYQYAIMIGNGAEKFGLNKRVWSSPQVQGKIQRGWLYDGNSLAWSLQDLGDRERSMEIDLDVDKKEDRPRNNSHPNVFRIVFKRTKRLDLSIIQSYLDGQCDFSNPILEGINFLDHLLRQHPSERFIGIRRSFFMRSADKTSLGHGVEALKGIYQSMRMVEGGKLSVNADVSNGTFWASIELIPMCCLLCNVADSGRLITLLAPIKSKAGKLEESYSFNELRRIRKLRVMIDYRGMNKNAEFKIDSLLHTDAKTTKFMMKDRETGKEEEISIEAYFLKRYNYRIKHPYLPIVQTNKAKVKLPMELLRVVPDQKYPFKLNESQTANMIRFAVTKPTKRKQDIEDGLRMVNWKDDPYLHNYGLKISDEMVETKARLLNPPTIQFKGNDTLKPGTRGSWMLKGIKFHITPPPLKSWGVLCYANCRMDKAKIEWFIAEFLKTFKSHGGIVDPAGMKPFLIHDAPSAAEPGLVTERLYMGTGKKFQMAPQILMFVVPDKLSYRYNYLKKTCECRYGVVSQVVLAPNAYKAAPQYLSNVMMKFNTKLGGTTSRIGKTLMGHYKVPTMVIGADVSHPTPGSTAPSVAAMTVSQDLYGARFAGRAQSNGVGVEMITYFNVKNTIAQNITNFISKGAGGKFPEHIWFFRDGVSEGAYNTLLNEEVRSIKRVCKEIRESWNPKILVIVCTKRHHVRFFPKPNDRAGAGEENPYPGVLVDHDVTHPRENDAYLCSHKAIQGTARPAHYHILLNETGLSNNDIYTTIYEQCYTFARSTTPVSIHPAVYYAHLVGWRSRPHEDIPSIAALSRPGAPRPMQGTKPPTAQSEEGGPDMEKSPLYPLYEGPDGPGGKTSLFKYSMWFV